MLNIYPTCTVYVKLYAREVGSSLTQEGWVHRLMNNNNIFERNTIWINPTSNIFRTYFGWIYVCALGPPQHKINISHCIFIGCNLQFSVANTLSTYMLRISKNGSHVCTETIYSSNERWSWPGATGQARTFYILRTRFLGHLWFVVRAGCPFAKEEA